MDATELLVIYSEQISWGSVARSETISGLDDARKSTRDPFSRVTSRGV